MNLALSLLGSFAIYKLQKKFSYYIILFNLGVILLGLFHNDFSIANLIQNKYINNIAIRKALIMQYILYYSVDSVNKRIIIIRFSHSEQDADKFFKTMNINQ